MELTRDFTMLHYYPSVHDLPQAKGVRRTSLNVVILYVAHLLLTWNIGHRDTDEVVSNTE